jgi:hypothetical protein
MKIKNIKKVRPKKVYAITTTTGTFVADDLAHHNCFRCNIMLKGNYDSYNLVMLQRHSKEEIIKMLSQKKEIVKLDYEEIYNEYKLKVENLRKTK